MRLRPNRKSLLNRRSTWLSRSPYIVPGATRFTTTVVRPPDNPRGNDFMTSAFEPTYNALIGGPAMLWNVPDNRTSTRGIVYDATALASVRKFVWTWQ